MAKTKMNRPGRGANRIRFPSRLREEVRGYAQSLAIAYLVVTFLFTTVGVVGASMEPNLDGGPGSDAMLASLLTGDRVFIPKYETWLRRANLMDPYDRGEVVVLRQPENAPHAQMSGRRSFFIKRVVGVPGDRVRIEAGQVFVNDQPIDQGFVTGTGEIDVAPVDFPVITQRDGEVTGFATRFVDVGPVEVPTLTRTGAHPPAVPVEDPRVQLFYGETVDSLAPIPEDAPEDQPFVHELVVPQGHYFVMGDNRSVGGSEDSRLFGPVPALSIAGRASAVIWPPRRDGEWNWRRLEPPRAFARTPDGTVR